MIVVSLLNCNYYLEKLFIDTFPWIGITPQPRRRVLQGFPPHQTPVRPHPHLRYTPPSDFRGSPPSNTSRTTGRRSHSPEHTQKKNSPANISSPSGLQNHKSHRDCRIRKASLGSSESREIRYTFCAPNQQDLMGDESFQRTCHLWLQPTRQLGLRSP